MFNKVNKKRAKSFGPFGLGYGLVAVSTLFGATALLAGCSGGGGSGGGGSASTAAPAVSGSIQNVNLDSIEIASVNSSGAIQMENSLNSGFQLLVDGNYKDSTGATLKIDATRMVTYRVEDEAILGANTAGLLTPKASGTTKVYVQYKNGTEQEITVSVIAPTGTTPTFTALQVLPAARTLRFVDPVAKAEQFQQVVVYATDTTGVVHDLTRSIAINLQDDQGNVTSGGNVDTNGLFRGVANGKIWVVGRITSVGLVAGAEFVLGTGVAKPVDPNALYSGGPLAQSNNEIDKAVLVNLFNLGVEPAETASEGTFLRRLYADAVGRVPTEAEATTYLASSDANKRTAEVDRLLATPEFSTHWASLMAEWYEMGAQQVAFEVWARDALASGRTLGEMTATLISGNVPAFDAKHDSPDKLAGIFLQTGAAMTARCATCHDHPLVGPNDTVKWTQADFYPVVAFFATNPGEATALDGRTNTRVGNPFDPGFALSTTPVTTTLASNLQARRDEFAAIFPASSAFKRGMAHRIFAEVSMPLLDPNQFLAKNLDAVAVPNVLAALETVFDSENTSLQGFLKQIFTSEYYSLSGDATTMDVAYDNLLQRHLVRRQHAEVMESALNELTGEVVNGGDLAFIQQTWGLPEAKLAIAERVDAVNMSQALVLLNSPVVQARISGAKVAQLAADVDAGTITQAEAIDQLWVSALSRRPTPAEVICANDAIGAAGTTEAGLQDVTSALAATVEFSMR
ncbi:MAG: DUF1549 domain-containing protein [Planctomycetes bacterium]|nr:DUF1549 domain-containing protein [Planctomycetota bacterium]